MLFIACIVVSDCYCLDVSLFEKIQDYEEKTLSSNKPKARQVFLEHVDHICFLPIVTLLYAFLKLNTYLDTFRIRICVWVVFLSPAVLSCHRSLPSFVMLSMACVFVKELWSSIHQDVTSPW
jgi:hypothetical protein